MARLQQKTSGHRVKREKLAAAMVRKALSEALKDRGMDMPRFGHLGPAKSKHSQS